MALWLLQEMALKQAVTDGLVGLFNFQDHFCSSNIIVQFVTVYPKQGTGTAAISAFAYLCCRAVQFVFLSLQSRAAKLPPYYSCSQCASPAAPQSLARLINHPVAEEHLLQWTSDHLPATSPQIWTLSLQCSHPRLIAFSVHLPCNKKVSTARWPS